MSPLSSSCPFPSHLNTVTYSWKIVWSNAFYLAFQAAPLLTVYGFFFFSVLTHTLQPITLYLSISVAQSVLYFSKHVAWESLLLSKQDGGHLQYSFKNFHFYFLFSVSTGILITRIDWPFSSIYECKSSSFCQLNFFSHELLRGVFLIQHFALTQYIFYEAQPACTIH